MILLEEIGIEMGGRGGGVAIYVRSTIPYTERNDLLVSNVEALCLEIRKPKSKALLMSTWYRPPSANIELLDFFNDFLRKADDENKDIVITGDFNCNFLATEYNDDIPLN